MKKLKEQVAAAVDAFQSSMKEAPPTLEARTNPIGAAPGGMSDEAAVVRNLMRKAQTPHDEALISDALLQYPDVAPGFLREEGTTPRGRVLAQFSETIQTLAQGATEAATNFARARSYAALRGFARIGGVLIGLRPEDRSASVDVRELSWTDGPRGLRLTIGFAGGRTATYGPFRAEIVRRALAYAADGRPITATMPLATFGRRVLIHPALVDSALGCESRLLDQFVDAATGEAAYREEAEGLISDQVALLEIAWADQFLRLDASVSATGDADVERYRASLRSRLPGFLTNKQRQEAAGSAVARPQDWSNASVSPISTKTAYFDQDLVNRIGNCLQDNHNLASVRVCLKIRALSKNYITSGHWLLEPPEARPESGVREVPYDLSADLDFLDLARHASDKLWPFDFMLQITFDSAPEFEDGSGPHFDTHPFEFPSIAQHIRDDVLNGIESGSIRVPNAARVLADLREFAVLQRFFRLALDGRLGNTFPLERLIALGHVRPHGEQPEVRTLTWNVQPQQYMELVSEGYGHELDALGYTRDLEQVKANGDRCPAVVP